MKKSNIIKALRQFVNQRSGIDCGNYSDYKSFMSDYRKIVRQGRDARLLLLAVAGRDGIRWKNVIDSSHAFSGRLNIEERDGSVVVEYYTGQYFPTEYRQAVCAVLSNSLWYFARKTGCKTGNDIRKWARGEFGRGIADRWFNF